MCMCVCMRAWMSTARMYNRATGRVWVAAVALQRGWGAYDRCPTRTCCSEAWASVVDKSASLSQALSMDVADSLGRMMVDIVLYMEVGGVRG